MGRIVRSAQPADSDGALLSDDDTDAGNGGGDGYLDRVAKYVPAEIVAFFIFVNSLLIGTTEKMVATALSADPTSPAIVRHAIEGVKMAGISVWTVSWIVLIVALLMTPVYLISVSKGDAHEHAYVNAGMAMLAFPFWAYAVDALAFKPWHDGTLATIMLATFTLISGAIPPDLFGSPAEPAPPDPQVQPAAAVGPAVPPAMPGMPAGPPAPAGPDAPAAPAAGPT